MEAVQHTKRLAVGYILAFGTVTATISDDPELETLACGVTAALMVGLLWRVGEPPALLMAVGVQLSQIVTPVLRANLLGVPLQDVSLHIGNLTAAVWFALAAVTSLVVGLWSGQLGSEPRAATEIQLDARKWSPNGAFAFCITTLVLAAVFNIIGGAFDGLRQPCLAASKIQWVGVFVLVCVCTAQRRGYLYLWIVTCLQIVEGFTGFFADFKEVFLVLLVGIFSIRPKFSAGKILSGIALISVLLTLGAWWTSIKDDYRRYISYGTYEQIAAVPIFDRLAFLTNKVLEADWKTMSSGFDMLGQRLGYVDWLAATMRRVPSHVPFQHGAQIGSAVTHVLEPRLLFPDKPPLQSDVAVLAKYTGINFGASTSSTTSISIGYLAELYVDFGILGGLAATFVLGFLVGGTVRFVSKSTKLPPIMSFGLIVMLVMSMMWFEESLVKTVGAFVTTLLAVLVLRRFLLLPALKIFGAHAYSATARMQRAL